MKKQRCIICGICSKDGIIIEGKKICSLCEERIMKAQEQTDFYTHYLKRIKKYIVPALKKGVNSECQNYH